MPHRPTRAHSAAADEGKVFIRSGTVRVFSFFPFFDAAAVKLMSDSLDELPRTLRRLRSRDDDKVLCEKF